MSHLSLRQTAAPSATLLKYLRAQTQGYPYFSANHLHTAKRASRHGNRGKTASVGAVCLGGSVKTWARSMTIATPCLESSLLPPLSSFLPRRRKPSAISFDASASESSRTSLSRYALSPADSPLVSSQTTRSASTSSDPHSERWREWRSGLLGWTGIWGPGRKQKERGAAQPLEPNDLPPLNNFLDDSAGLGRVVRPINELRLRCTEFDEHGNVTLVNGEFKKSELIAKVCFEFLLPRHIQGAGM